MRQLKLKRFCTIATSAFLASTILASTVHIHTSPSSPSIHVSLDSEASARSSGGRSGGGSFRSTPSRSTPSRSTPSRSYNNSPSYSRDRYNNGPTVVPVPVPVGPGVYHDPYRSGYSNTSRTSDDGSWIVGLIILIIFVGIFILMIYAIVRGIRQATGAGGSGELNNNKVTVSKIQVALLSQARYIQDELTALSTQVDTGTSEGLLQLLQESALSLLRSPENWSHVLASSQMVKNREEAETLFNKLSIAERSKFSVETLTNVGGRGSQRKEFKPDVDEDPAAYIVVTLLVGTAHDKPLFTEIRTEQALTTALEQLASMPADYLMVFELLWSPQDASDSLTYDELLTEYTDMVQI